MDLLLGRVVALTCTEVHIRGDRWSSEGAHWISSLVVYLSLLALKCTLGGTNGPLRELIGSSPESFTCPYLHLKGQLHEMVFRLNPSYLV